jgi:hypothetical protein
VPAYILAACQNAAIGRAKAAAWAADVARPKT